MIHRADTTFLHPQTDMFCEFGDNVSFQSVPDSACHQDYVQNICSLRPEAMEHSVLCSGSSFPSDYLLTRDFNCLHCHLVINESE